VLENAIVRAAAVASLAKFGVNTVDSTVKRSVGVLLSRCLDDVDDEVRDRAAMYLRVINDSVLAETYVTEDSVFSLSALESKLVSYVSDTDASEQPFNTSEIPKISRAQMATEVARPSSLDVISAPAAKRPDAAAAAPSVAQTQSAYAEQLAGVPEFANYGPVLNSSAKPAPLTESETEYVVTCVKHLFKEHVVFQFNISNTLPDTVLEQVSVIMQLTSDAAGLTEDFIIPIPQLTSAQSPGIFYASFTRDEPNAYPLASFQCMLKFISKELDPASGEPEEEGYGDEYQLEEVELGAGGDYIVPNYATFGTEWERMRDGAVATETFALAMESIKAAVDSIIEILNMEPLGGTEHPTSTSLHALQLSGLVTGGGGKVLVRCRMTYSTGQGVTLELSVRAEKEEAMKLVIAAIGG